MTINATAKSKIFIGTTLAAATLAEFEADTYIEVKEVEDLGEWGAEGTEITFKSLADSHVRRRKGTIDSGSVALVCARDPLDEGQNAARAAVEEWLPYNFKVELNDKPTATGENTVFYFRAVVMSARNNFSGADNITKTTFNLGIDGAILEVPASVVIVFTPLAGALPGGTNGVAYSQTIAASGGIGAPSYAVTAGALPAGLTLNATTGAISGTPTAAGNASFTVTATFAGSGVATAAYTLNVT